MIASFGVRWYRIPREIWWPLDLGDTQHHVTHIELIVCRVRTGEGVESMGYTYTLGYGGSAVFALLAQEIGPLLVGRRIASVPNLWHELWWRFHWVGRAGVLPVAIAAAEIALWDSLAKAADLPLFRYLGATRESVPVYGSAVDMHYELSQVLDGVEAYKERGFSAFKMKVGRTIQEDVQRVRAVRELIGPDARLMVDANMGWSLAEAAGRIRSIEEHGISWIEEPLIPEDVEGHAALQAQTTIPVAVGETLFSPYEFRNYMERKAIRIAQPDVTRLGGIAGWRAVANLAEAFQVPVAPHFMQDIHVHLLCSVPNGLVLEYLPWFDHFLEEPIEVVDGVATPPDRPGHGIALRDDVIRPFLMASS